MLEAAVRIALAGVLAIAVAAKLREPARSAEGMRTFGFASPAARWTALVSVVAIESVLAVAVAAGSDTACYLAAAAMLLFAATLGSAMLRGQAGAPCGCYGPRSTVGPLAIARNLALAAAFAAVPSLPETSTGTDAWLALGLAVALAACAALAVAVLALAREVGMLRLRLGPEGALEVSHEGPELGGRTGLIEHFETGPRAEFALAVFTSVGCHVCRALAPAVDSLRAEPALSVRSFEESADAEIWEALAIPGAPYALAMDLEGTVLAKGTFNNLAQLESIVATAERRRGERARIEALGV